MLEKETTRRSAFFPVRSGVSFSFFSLSRLFSSLSNSASRKKKIFFYFFKRRRNDLRRSAARNQFALQIFSSSASFRCATERETKFSFSIHFLFFLLVRKWSNVELSFSFESSWFCWFDKGKTDSQRRVKTEWKENGVVFPMTLPFSFFSGWNALEIFLLVFYDSVTVKWKLVRKKKSLSLSRRIDVWIDLFPLARRKSTLFSD